VTVWYCINDLSGTAAGLSDCGFVQHSLPSHIADRFYSTHVESE